jgi:hypothetical protein
MEGRNVHLPSTDQCKLQWHDRGIDVPAQLDLVVVQCNGLGIAF